MTKIFKTIAIFLALCYSSGMKKIYILKESEYANASYILKIVGGVESAINHKTDELCNITMDDLSQLPAKTVILILSFTSSFISKALRLCQNHNLRPLLVGVESSDSVSNISYVTVDRADAMKDNVLALIQAGATDLALLGINPAISTDIQFMNGWLEGINEKKDKVKKQKVFYSNNDLLEAVHSFCEQAREYNAVCCANDYVAIFLLPELRKKGIKVPDNLMVMGLGSQEISRYTMPSLSTIKTSLRKMGSRAVSIYKLLADDKSLASLSCIIEHECQYRDSTPDSISLPQPSLSSDIDFTPLINKPYEQGLSDIWHIANAYANTDETDRNILRGINSGMSYNQIAETYYLSDSGLRYRLNKLYRATHVNSKEELKRLLNMYFPNLC